ncbi:MAG: G-D-S-L family lipolytic protein [Winogradskyella sp.]
MKNIKYIALSLLISVMFSCENEELDALRNGGNDDSGPLPELTAGTVDFSNYVAVGASFTAGFTDNGLFIASQENSFPNTLFKEFSKIGGGVFTQPWMSDNFGGLAAAGTRITQPRLVFGGAGPVPLESVIGSVTVGTDIVLNNPTGPFNNLGVPGAKSFHLVAPGYGNLANFPAAANPYAVRLTGNTPNASVLDLAMAQNPTFFTLSEIGGNDVLGYATSGGDGSNPITDTATFDASLNALVAGLTANGAKGAIANLPNITSLSFFTTVPHNPLDPTNPAFGPQIPTLNATFASLNGAYAFLGVPERSIVYSETEASPVIINDESLPNIAVQLNAVLQGGGVDPLTAGLLANQFGQSRQATADDLLTLTSSTVIATLNEAYFNQLVTSGVPAATAGQLSINGVTFPLQDTFVLLPSEQQEIAEATDAYNSSISATASANGLALVDLNSVLDQASSTGISFDEYFLNTDLVFGGLVSLDGVHLTARGYALMANSFLEAIDATYGSNFAASGNMAKANDFDVAYSALLQ